LISGKINVELIDLEQSQILFIEDVWDVKAKKEERLSIEQKRNTRVAIN